MKFFTKEWWASGSEGADEIFARYERNLESISKGLPKALLELHKEHTLHDAEVKQVECDFIARSVSIRLHGWDAELKHKVRYVLKFENVSQFEQTLPQEEYVEEELGDLGYWECSLVGPDVQVEMLFVSGAEFRILFQGFRFSNARYGDESLTT
jgi:hypothetical protein